MSKDLNGIGYFSSTRIPLNDLAHDNHYGTLVKREKGFILFQYSDSTYIYVKDFGGIAFIYSDDGKPEKFLKQLQTDYGAKIIDQTDTIEIKVGDKEQDGFGKINIESLDTDSVHIIALNLANSATLFYYQELSDKLIEDTRVHTSELELKGKVSLGRKKLMKYIGSTLNLKNKISENLYVFETPMLAYENERLGNIDSRLRDDLEIQLRYNGIKEQLNIIHENLDLFKDLSLHKHSSNLEWIIILLILFEVVHVLVEKII